MSDTMCAKTTETSRCQRCGSEFDWLSDGTKVHAGKQYFESDSLLCLERQLNAANQIAKNYEDRYFAALDRIKRLEDAGDRMYWTLDAEETGSVGKEMWRKAKEDKP